MASPIDFRETFTTLTGHPPFPWQETLFKDLLHGIGNHTSLDIPTGLGKTSVMSVWLIARSHKAPLPRRLVYIVDRRAVVDQATHVAERIRTKVDSLPDVKLQLGLEDEQSLPISTLRGKYVDNRQWLEDPSAPAIILGTVDMIGSRLLFEGYGVSRKMRPYHAGLLGVDTLFVLDEAHLVPPFEMMLQTLVGDESRFGPDRSLAELVPKLKLLSLSATGRGTTGVVWGLTEADLHDESHPSYPIMKKRLEAIKRLSFRESDDSKPLAELLAEEAWSLAEQGTKAVRIIVFNNSRDVAGKAKAAIEKLAKGDKNGNTDSVTIETELFVGARRVYEREQVAEWLNAHGFLAGSENGPQLPTFLFATSAGEVGVDLDADHMVCDLVQWERMVQRLGRVNRRGNGDATIRVVYEVPQSDKKIQEAIDTPEADRSKAQQKKVDDFTELRERVERFRRPLLALPKQESFHDASPGAISVLKKKANDDSQLESIIASATSPVPLRPALTRAVVDAWSMTSLEKHTGRPIVAPWLRGWVDDKPQTTVIWRKHLPICQNSDATMKRQMADAAEFFEQAPPHLSETLQTESQRVFDWLVKRAKVILKHLTNNQSDDEGNDQVELLKRDSTVAMIVDQALSVERFVSLKELAFEGDDAKRVKRQKNNLQREITNNTLVIDARFGGLSESGLLDDSANLEQTTTGDDGVWELTGFRVRMTENENYPEEPDWRTCYRFVSNVSEDEKPLSWLFVQEQKDTITSEDARAITKTTQALATHQEWAEREVERLAALHELPEEYSRMLKVAARLHDEGKQSNRWQNAFSAPPDERPYAKTKGPVKTRHLDGYRHEFGSLPYVERDPEFQALSPDLQNLALHLVAAHHGFARPLIRTTGCEDAPPSALEDRAREVALRFVRLQRRWGPWGLAWWESMLRAADQRASRALDEASLNQDERNNELQEVQNG